MGNDRTAGALFRSEYDRSIQVGNDRYEVKEGTFDDGTTGPIEIHPFQRTLVLFAWGEDGAFLGARIKVTPWVLSMMILNGNKKRMLIYKDE